MTTASILTLAAWQAQPGEFACSARWSGGMELNTHRFKVGQSVRFNASTARRFSSSASFKIVKLLPPEGDHQQYRIKSPSEAHERIAKENELNQDS
jgi:hypothetical protein